MEQRILLGFIAISLYQFWFFHCFYIQFKDRVLLDFALMEGPAWMGLTPTVNMDLHACVCGNLTA